MTINVAVSTSEALVFGCDSIASTTRHLLDPFALNPVDLGNGKHKIEFDYGELIPHVSGAWGGVTKMFPLQDEENGASVAAVTAGLAVLNGRTISNLAAEFFGIQSHRAQKRANVEVIAKDFLRFLRKEYIHHYRDSNVPQSFWDGPEFIVGGYGKDDQLPSLYRVNVAMDTVTSEYTAGEFGVLWAGQSDAVVRLIRGYDYPLQKLIESEVQKAVDDIYDSTSSALASILQEVLDKLEADLPDGINTNLPSKKAIELSWNDYSMPIYCQGWPIQDAIEFAAFLVNMQSGKAKYLPGVATVGGRTHIGIVTKSDGFNMLNEPELTHRNTGFINDL